MAVTDCLRMVKNMPPFNLLQDTNVSQCLMYGMEGAGKTTLLYKLKCPLWKKEQLVMAVENIKNQKGVPGPLGPSSKDPAYHYEVFADSFKYTIWEVPALMTSANAKERGSDQKEQVRLNMTNLFYKFLNVTCVFFVADTRPETVKDMVKMEEAKRLFDFLLNEDELRKCVFILIYNVHEESAKPGKGGEEVLKDKKGKLVPSIVDDSKKLKLKPYENAVSEFLEIEKVKEAPQHKMRFKDFRINCAEINRFGTEWLSVVSFIKTVLKDGSD